MAKYIISIGMFFEGKRFKMQCWEEYGCFLTSKEDFETKFRVFKGKFFGK